MPPLSCLEVLAVDCQATAAAPRGHIIELGWTRARSGDPPRARLIALPPGERIPPAVARITGISDRMAPGAVQPGAAWAELLEDAARLAPQPAPAVIHFARFERPFLDALAGGAPPLDIVCTHDIARRLFPGLPRRSLRALAGYFGRAMGTLRRSADHVTATAFLWEQLVPLLESEGVSTWDALRTWLASPAEAGRRAGRAWPMPRAIRLAAPDAPGIYRMLRTSGDVLYVGKAASLRARVNSYFRHQRGVKERTLEMLSQARAISFEVAGSPLEAALREADEIKRLRPPYNVALTEADRHLWFTPPDLSERSPRPSRRHCVGPFPSAETLDAFTALAHASRAALGMGRWAPAPEVFDKGCARLRASHPELSHQDLAAHARLLRLGTRLWREGRRDRDEGVEDADRRPSGWTAEQVQASLERLILRAALARRRAVWLTRLMDAAIAWSEPDQFGCRLLVVQCGEIVEAAGIDEGATTPVPVGHARPVADRHEAFTIARFDRVRVLTTELKRLVASAAPVAVRFGPAPAIEGARLAAALSWV